ncbi:hypothetical protein AXG93_3943s1170 [Marchantia polymorpha subsp. ruderalis]|uniref:Reverse transcriptase Ty1/copia-type domain-containing protein n=1 Tax=Marchantia polymorpha subsp. ruderalis TaxID=1480154 RepID=A0A176WFH6_MARPO|nr:hypothetical protein AXG93_3943s1170 [Marchantia polymorpha subsp. ruderalis]
MVPLVGDEWPVTKDAVLPEEEHTPIATNVPVSPSGSVPCPETMSPRSCTVNRSNGMAKPQLSLGAPELIVRDDNESSPDVDHQHPQSFTEAPINDFSIDIPIQPDGSHHAMLPLHTYQRRKNVPSAHITLDRTDTTSSDSMPPSTRSSRTRKPSSRLADFYIHLTEHAPEVSLPISIDDALLHPGWKSAMDDELASIYKNGTWDLVPLPSDRKAIITKLHKALYGLKQAPRAWYTKVDAYLLSQGLTKSQADYNLYFHLDQGKITLLLLYVDDVYLTGDNDAYIAFIKSEIQQAFEMFDLELLSYSLGIEIMFQPDGISVTQRQYIRVMQTKFGLDKCKPAPTRMMD